MFRIASEFAGKYEAKFIITGESLGQVASQTLENIFAEHSAARVHVLRPLIGLDKLEIERIAKLCGTFSISTRPGMCCTIVPEKPATCASVEQIQIEEKKIDFDEMVRVSVCSAEKI
jgi:thiamine biosynthesis protein ThiI